MKRGLLLTVSCFLVVVSLFTACRPDPDFNATSVTPKQDISFHIPEGWPQPFYNFENNALTTEGFELGKKLFFDTRLSVDNSTSCGSCHQPFSAFAQLDHSVSHGVNDLLGTRNSPALFNLNWNTSFFWDGGVNHIESQPINPIQNPVEMDETMPNVIAKVGADTKYKAMFKAAFGDETVTSQRIFKAMAQFMGMLVSSTSKYDKHIRQEAGGEFTAAEERGLTVFRDNCATCHKEPLFTDMSFRNNGLSVSPVNDSGRAHITRLAEDMYKFRVPSLRNLKYTPPYMHDGRFNTLDQVMLHYTNGGIVQSPTLDTVLKSGVINITGQQKADLLEFLNTLNDEEFTKDPRFKEVVSE
ncbi:MAG: cytochrome-c peroxidase [Sphingobacteriales bacterium]|nr:MAG: cytochrome-c peroxidase [Sphingobacteriales bacterium]